MGTCLGLAILLWININCDMSSVCVHAVCACAVCVHAVCVHAVPHMYKVR
jgi:hypothetical protein